MAPPSNLIVGHHFDYTSSAWFLDVARGGGNRKPTINGIPAVDAGGKFGSNCVRFDQSGHDSMEWSGNGIVDDLIQTGCVSFWIFTRYSGSPATSAEFYYSGGSAGNTNRVALYHTTSGFVQGYIHNSAASVIGSVSAAWAPAASTWYHFEINFDVTAGAIRVFINGVQHGSTHTGTGTRNGTNNNFLSVGKNHSTANQNFWYMDELLIFDAVQHTAGFSVPVAPALFEYETDLIVPELIVPGDIMTGRQTNPIAAGLAEG
jgi:hypothetical protein